jgi:hypothetical protein
VKIGPSCGQHGIRPGMAIQSTIGVRALEHHWNIEEISRLPVVE